MKPAVFLDRDGTLIEHVHYLSDPVDVQLVRGAAQAVRALREAGYLCVIVTNQSAVGRGLLTLRELYRVNQEVIRQLSEEGATIDGWYFCPVVPRTSDRITVEHPDRKPGPGMLLRAAREMSIDLPRSWMIGDMISDAVAGQAAGCKARILVRNGVGDNGSVDHPAVSYVVDDIQDAVELMLHSDAHSNPCSTRPSTETIKRDTA